MLYSTSKKIWSSLFHTWAFERSILRNTTDMIELLQPWWVMLVKIKYHFSYIQKCLVLFGFNVWKVFLEQMCFSSGITSE
jgi:hypothetical protein